MSNNNVWYLSGPFHQYNEDVKAMAKMAGLRIIDANVTESREGAAEEVPEVTLRPELSSLSEQVFGEASGGVSSEGGAIAGLRQELEQVGLIVESFSVQSLERPEGELGEAASRLFQVLEAVNAGVESLRRERDGEAEKAQSLQRKLDELVAQIAQARQASDGEREASEVAELKARLDAANVTYRANASKESLEKLVAELPKE